MAILYLKKMGCDFDFSISNVMNYRVRTTGENIPMKNGKMYFLEFTGGHATYDYRQVNKRTGEPLKKGVRELRNKNQLILDTNYTDNNGSWCDCPTESMVYDLNLSYTLENILFVVNMLSTEHYEKIVFI